MQTTLRTWIAALALAFSAFVLTLASPAEQLAERALLPMFVVFVVAWLVAVGERATVPRGGLRVRRFPLGPRLLQVRPGLGAQFIAMILMLTAVAGWKVGMWAAVITAVVTIHSVRKISWYAIPAIWLLNTLATMPEFHTLGDLVHDMSDWTKALVIFGIQALIVCGPLLRTDVGGQLSVTARVVALLAGLPAWLAAGWVFSRTPLAGKFHDGEALALTVLAGGLMQSLLLATVAKWLKIEDRLPEKLPVVVGHGVGLALMPMMLPILAVASLAVLNPSPATAFGGSPAAWAGLMALMCIVPALLSAGLVGAALDRVDGRGQGFVGAAIAGSLLGAWFLLGPLVLQGVYAPDGVAASLRAAFDTRTGGPALVSSVIPGSSPLSGHSGGQLALFGLPAADLCRAVTLMFIGLAALCARYMRHARGGQRPAGWGAHLLLLTFSAGAAYELVPRLGAVGAPLACAASAAIVLAMDLFHAELRVKTADELLAEELAREEAEVARHRAERAAMAGAAPREIVG